MRRLEKFPPDVTALQMNSRIVVAVLLLLCSFRGAIFGAENPASNGDNNPDQSQVNKPWVRKLAFGILGHDVGFISDHKQRGGVDPNWELQFNPPEWRWWHWVGSPSPMAGATPNFNEKTSAFYLGLAWEISLSNRLLDKLTNDFTKRLWLSPGVSAAAHTGPLHKNDEECRATSDCGFGYRVIPRVQLELGVSFWENHAISLFIDHMSHKGLGHAQNQGLDHTGIRYLFTFNKPSSSDMGLKEQAP
jgi:lipid A 3-O-deacylase